MLLGGETRCTEVWSTRLVSAMNYTKYLLEQSRSGSLMCQKFESNRLVGKLMVQEVNGLGS